MNECVWSIGRMMVIGETRSTWRKKIVLVPLCLPQIPYGPVCGWTVPWGQCRLLTAWGVTRLCSVEFQSSYQGPNLSPISSVIITYTSNWIYQQLHRRLFIYVVVSLRVFGSFASCFKSLTYLLQNSSLLFYCVQTVNTSRCMVLNTRYVNRLPFLTHIFQSPTITTRWGIKHTYVFRAVNRWRIFH